MTTGLKANVDGSAAIQVGGVDAITLTSAGAASFVTSPMTIQGGSAAAPSLTFSGDTNTGIFSPAADTIAFSEGGVESMRIDASGNLGIGTTSPIARLQLVNSSANCAVIIDGQNATARGAFVNFKKGGTDTAYIGQASSILGGSSTSNDLLLWADGAINQLFYTNGAERARITSDGRFLIGKTTTSTANQGIVFNSNANCVFTVTDTGASDTLNVWNDTAGAYRFYVTRGGTIFATSTTISAISDIRLKENIQDLDVGLDAVMALKPRKFDWKEGKGKNIKGDRGWIAQEFEQVFPDMISTWKDEPPEGEEPYKSVGADLIPVLVKAMQQQQAMIDEMKAEIAALKAQP